MLALGRFQGRGSVECRRGWRFQFSERNVQVLHDVCSQMQLDPHGRFDLVHEGTVLQPTERPIVSFGLKDGAKLELVATGSGV